MVEVTKRYLAARLDPSTSFGYGLFRRSEMLATAVSKFAANTPAPPFDVIDFGCADGAMLESLSRHLGDRMRGGVGLDVFRAGVPTSRAEKGPITFLEVDLFKQYPYPLPTASRDIAVISAFLKHHPEPSRFLREVGRILRPGGIAVVLDPRPLVVRVGVLFGRFNPRYNPSVWDIRFVRKMIAGDSASGLRVEHFERYWVAPNHSTYNMGLERHLPKQLVNWCAMHQCVVLRRE